MNNGVCTERGLLGQFTNSTYVTLGDPYGKKAEMLSRYKKKQFLTMPAKKAVVSLKLTYKADPNIVALSCLLKRPNWSLVQCRDLKRGHLLCLKQLVCSARMPFSGVAFHGFRMGISTLTR